MTLTHVLGSFRANLSFAVLISVLALGALVIGIKYGRSDGGGGRATR